MELILEDNTRFNGNSFGARKRTSGEVVFSTGMVGYVESLTDPSYKGQILVLTYPLIGNYGVPDASFFESKKIHASGLVVSEYSESYSHTTALHSLGAWLKKEGFDYLDMLTAVDYLGPVDMKGYIRQQNFNPFLPEGGTPQIESAPTAGYPYRPVMDLLYVFFSVKERARVFVRLEQPRENVSVPSLVPLFKSADWQERETFDLLGVRFEGHPNLVKILTPDFTQGHPLRKDYVHIKDRFDE